MQKDSPTKKQLNVFVIGIDIILLFFAWKFYKTNNIRISIILIIVAFGILITYLINKKIVIQFYKVWMQCASAIGLVVTGILMVFIFYLVFTPVGLFLRLIRKDVLSLKKDERLKTYWINKPQREFNKSDYERQF